MKLATIEQIESVVPHPNADRLDIVRVLGYDAIVKRDSFMAGQIIVFVQPDTVLPTDHKWAAPYIPFTKAGRVRAVRLRGEWSMGLVLALPELAESYGREGMQLFPEKVIGDEVSDHLGVLKYEPPMPGQFGSTKGAKLGLPLGIPKTDEERYQNLGKRFWDEHLGKHVDVTLKIDGSSVTVFCLLPKDVPLGEEQPTEPIMGVCSRSLELQDTGNVWWEAIKAVKTLEQLRYYCEANDVSLALRGEIYGQGIQGHGNNPHAKLPLGVAFYEVYNLREGRVEGSQHQHYYQTVCYLMHLPVVPCLEKGVPLTPELLVKYDRELSEVDGKPFEGVVIKGDGFSFKVINKHYDSAK